MLTGAQELRTAKHESPMKGSELRASVMSRGCLPENRRGVLHLSQDEGAFLRRGMMRGGVEETYWAARSFYLQLVVPAFATSFGSGLTISIGATECHRIRSDMRTSHSGMFSGHGRRSLGPSRRAGVSLNRPKTLTRHWLMGYRRTPQILVCGIKSSRPPT